MTKNPGEKNAPSKKFVPYNKLSKKEQKELNNARRGDWNGVKPYTRTINNKKRETKADRARAKVELKRDL